MLYQTSSSSCHSCCNINQMCHQQQQMMNMGSCCSSCHCSTSNHFNQSNQFYYPTNNYSTQNYSTQMNNCCMSNLGDPQFHYQQQLKATSPMKQYNPIISNPISEQNEDTDFESLNCLMENENEEGELDFDRLLNCKGKQVVSKQLNKNQQIDLRKNVIVKSKLTSQPKDIRKSRENFNELKNRWEQVSSSKQTSPTTPSSASSTTSKKQLVKTKDKEKTNERSNQQANKRQTVRNTRNNQVKLTTTTKVTNRRSRSKSPEKSNKEVIILTTKKSSSSKLQEPLKSATTNSNTLTRKAKQSNRTAEANQQQTTANKKPVRPSNFNTQLKRSMIPVPKTTNRSPPLK